MNKKVRTLLGCIITLAVIPAAIILWRIFGGENYFVFGLLLVIMAFVPAILHFERNVPTTRELVILAVMVAIAVAGRAAFFMTPQFKPVCAIVIVAGVCFGAENGFIVGMITALVSNFLFSQGVWTPFQMFALGLVGFFAGLLFCGKKLRKSRVALCVYGALSTFVIYGGIADISTILMLGKELNLGGILTVYTAAVPFNVIHAASTVFFLLIFGKPMTEKLDRVRYKYGIFTESPTDRG